MAATEAELYKRALDKLGDPDKAAAFVAKYLEGKSAAPKSVPAEPAPARAKVAPPVKDKVEAPRPKVGVTDGSVAMRNVAPTRTLGPEAPPARALGPEVPPAVRFLNSPGAARMAEPREAVAYESMRAAPQTGMGRALKGAREQLALRTEIARDIVGAVPSAKDVADYTVGMGWAYGTPGTAWRERQAEARAREAEARKAEDERLAARAGEGNERIRQNVTEAAAQLGFGAPEASKADRSVAAPAQGADKNSTVLSYRARLKTVVPEGIDVDAMSDKQVIAMMASPEVTAALRE